MVALSKEEIFLRLKDRYDPWEVVELLGVSMEEVWDDFEDDILAHKEMMEEIGLFEDQEEEEDLAYVYESSSDDEDDYRGADSD